VPPAATGSAGRVNPSRRRLTRSMSSGFDRVAQPFGRVDEWHMSGLVGRQPLVFDDPEIVLQHPVGDDDVTDMQSPIQSARDSGENYCVATESVGQQRCHQRGVHLARAGCGQHNPVRVHSPASKVMWAICSRRTPDSTLRR